MAAPPAQPVNSALSYEEKQERKAAREARKKEKLEKAKNAVRGRLRGWHKKPLFEHEGKYYSYGKEVTEFEAVKLRKELAEKEANTLAKKPLMSRKTSSKKVSSAPAGKGRGWHLKKTFTFDGKFYSFGKEISEKEYKKLLKA